MELSRLKEFAHIIINLPEKPIYEKSDLLIDSLLLHRDRNIEIYYSTHNEYINEGAKIILVGITPGWTQMEKSINIARRCLLENKSFGEIAKISKEYCRFWGSMRSNLITMLDELNLNQYLDIKSSSELFLESKELLHTTSMISYPVFINGKNYSGHSPDFMGSELLKKYIFNSFKKEIRTLENPFIVPLGKSVERALKLLIVRGVIEEEQCLFGFPHPSGANGHRLKQFKKNKESMMKSIERYFKQFKILRTRRR